VCNRRQFLVHAMWLAVPSTAMRAFVRQVAEPRKVTESGVGDREALVAVLDEIIPASDGMPSAGATGAPQYLQYLGLQYPQIQEEIKHFLKGLGQASAAAFGDEFPKLRSDQRVKVLAAMERTRSATFSSFVNYVYEAYYMCLQVFGLLACSMPPLPVEDPEELLVPVRKLTHLYRDVS